MSNMGSLEEVDMDISEGSDMEVSDEERLTQMQVQAKYKHFGTTSAIAPSGHRVLVGFKDTRQAYLDVYKGVEQSYNLNNGRLQLDPARRESEDQTETESVSSYKTAETSFSDDEPGLITRDDEKEREKLLQELESYQRQINDYEEMSRRQQEEKKALAKKSADIKLEILNLQVRMSIRQREIKKQNQLRLKAAERRRKAEQRKWKTAEDAERLILPGSKAYKSIEKLLSEGAAAAGVTIPSDQGTKVPKTVAETTPPQPATEKATEHQTEAPLKANTTPAPVEMPSNILKRDKGKEKVIFTYTNVPNEVLNATIANKTSSPLSTAQAPKAHDTSNVHTMQETSPATEPGPGTDIIFDVAPMKTATPERVPNSPVSKPVQPTAPQKGAFKPYKSPLDSFGLRSRKAAVPNTEGATRQMCKYETLGGTCNDDTCKALHFRDFQESK